jgi:hypothetical protein
MSKTNGNGKPEGGKRKPGRPPIEIDPAQVEAMAAIGCTPQEVGAVLGCSDQTIRGRFLEEMEKGRASMKMSLRRRQVKAAENGNITMLIWLGKQYLGQSDKTEISEGPTDIYADPLADRVNPKMPASGNGNGNGQ